jgi:hypothetical protein
MKADSDGSTTTKKYAGKKDIILKNIVSTILCKTEGIDHLFIPIFAHPDGL